MLRADADLVCRDPAIPALALILNPEALSDLLQQVLPESGIQDVHVTYLRYKPGTNCLAACRIVTAATDVAAYLKAYQPGMREKLEKARVAPTVRSPLGPGRRVLDEYALILSVFPNDLQIRGLAAFADRAKREDLLREVLGGHHPTGDTEVRTLRYKPERRYVARLVGAGTEAVIRAYARAEYAAARRTTQALRSIPPLRLPRFLGRSTSHQMLAVEWIKGVSLAEVVAAPAYDGLPGCGVGEAIAALHAQRGENLSILDKGRYGAILRNVAGTVGFVWPRAAALVERVVDLVASTLPDHCAYPATLHGDLHAGQVVITDGGIALVDMDEAICGDPAIDLGRFIAHLERDALTGRLSPQAMAPLRDQLLKGYEAGQPLPPRIDLYTAAELLRLAPQAFRERGSNWPEETEAIIERAETACRRAQSDLAIRSVQPSRGFGSSSRGRSHPTGPADPVLVDDPFGATRDSAMPFLKRALEPGTVASAFGQYVPGLTAQRSIKIRAIRVVRYKPGRRCLVEYDLQTGGTDRRIVTLVGKARAKGLDSTTHSLACALWRRGFDDQSADGISVPEPIGIVPPLRMWLQRKAPGIPATTLLTGPDAPALAERIAAALYKLHHTAVIPRRCHTIDDELRILQAHLAQVAFLCPQWAERVGRVCDACHRLAAHLPRVEPCGIHRDFYADQVVVNNGRLFLLDFDQYARGDPALDVGNFLGHLTEQAVRTLGAPDALRDASIALERHYAFLSGTAIKGIRIYATLTIVRHVSLSMQFPDRRPFTEQLLCLAEQQLGQPRPIP